ncbi:diacylglycerol kinase family enzyme/membrane-associated phospholipid phosphatase [Streptomyces sp. B4I13]|uniref:diacylglycerol kinase family protein n=1 Tax=Streptomyces sp. B4I13 TaxID=3042271 RepID=UPI00278714A6|nr:diacylglycerol kinase family protein [Streptomyces sp. B4I13]MDQ0956602.1 diacylglycerol kinase family enzyme/membrane-associated phospholipid phosphatase [Streptomyces sp. B4I13]
MPTAAPERPAELPGRRPGTDRAGRSFALPRGTGRAAARIGALTVCQGAVMVGCGLLITGPARGLWPMTVEDDVDEGLANARTGTLTTLSFFGSEAGNTLTVIAVTVLACAGLILIPRLPMWRQAAFLAVAVSLQSLVFLVITEAVDRHRPEVHRLDASPPTSSYTSGHTGAATAVYGGLAVLALSRLRGPWRRIVGGLLLVVPVVVALARLYRGMHHPTDVMGGLVNGSLSLLIVGRALLTDVTVTAAADVSPAPSSASTRTGTATRTGASGEGRAAVIINPTVTGAADRETLHGILDRHGYRAPVFIETTAEDPGTGQTAGALRDGAGLVVVCGGDGTLRAAADALAGSGVPLAVVPCGTGNLLARNLGLPLSPTDALDAALRGTPHRLDLGRIEGDALPATHFAAMSGAGLDAAIMEHTNDRAKSVLGWPAYVLAGIGTLRTPRMRLTVRLDDAPALRRTARMVLIGNVGTVQGGTTLLPAARPDDGLLDLLLLDPRGIGGWTRALATLVRGGAKGVRPSAADTPSTEDGDGDGVPVEFFTFRRAELTFDSVQSRELDGDPVTRGRRLTAEVRPGALTVLLPAGGE